MLTFEDCLGLSDLTEDEILAIAEHEHIPELAALELGNFLIRTRGGERRLKRMILDDIDIACAMGDTGHAASLRLVLKHYCQEHRV
ncbi:MAG: hypothetical protein A3G25_15135 [Betaproteobacteria bacterium RIFCSPLOWO2_12_FULL_63_13]|nr:MAG: hypothetical protein A3H32_18190 [Betaproteobacteria bacterium RIFCSPLOWO2_02_FULL_63_19]OGA53832.1 MAG: hypothetical protein A3G25_15135 [Betaproteobacteria bacterium RIFCSPLOWO2_12_FULL_63_13]